MSVVGGEQKTRGVIYGRSLDQRPLPPAAEVLPNGIRVADMDAVSLPQKTWRDQLRLFLQASGLTTIPGVVRLRWQAHDVIDWLQGSLLGKGRGRRANITHPLQLMPAIEFMMGTPAELDLERRMMQALLGRGLMEYRRRLSQARERPLVFAREASACFMAGFKEQQLVGRISSPAEHFQTVQRIYRNYYFFRTHYIFSIIAREPPESGSKLFSKFMRVSFFLSTIQDDGTIAAKPSYRLLPPKEHVVFLAKRDAGLQAKLREDEQLRAELQQVLKYFRPLRQGPL